MKFKKTVWAVVTEESWEKGIKKRDLDFDCIFWTRKEAREYKETGYFGKWWKVVKMELREVE